MNSVENREDLLDFLQYRNSGGHIHNKVIGSEFKINRRKYFSVLLHNCTVRSFPLDAVDAKIQTDLNRV